MANIFNISDICLTISNYVYHPKDWLSFSLINKTCASVSHQQQTVVKQIMSNPFYIIFNMFPNKHWNYIYLSKLIPWVIIEKYPDNPWNWEILGQRNPPLGILKKFINKPWDWEQLVYDNSNITMDFVKKYPHIDWNWNGLSQNKYFGNLENVYKHSDMPWNWNLLAETIINNNIDKLPNDHLLGMT